MKIAVKLCGVIATITYLPADGELILNPDGISGILRNKYGDRDVTILEK
jgi:hypothetical protein